jgi:hypothetical protein
MNEEEHLYDESGERVDKWREGRIRSIGDLLHMIFCGGSPDPRYSMLNQRCSKCGRWRHLSYGGDLGGEYGLRKVKWYKKWPYKFGPIFNTWTPESEEAHKKFLDNMYEKSIQEDRQMPY